jgi:TonB-dependent starch-binding outer membrane protein SusC
MWNLYNYIKLPRLILLLLTFVISGQIQAQERSVSGKVTSSEDGSAIPGVSIIVTGTTTGTITDLDGNYKLNVPSGATLTFSSVGYGSQTIEVGTRSVLDMVLQPDITELSEIVVIGYGTREKKDLTGAISVMEAEDIEKSVAMAPELAMQGRMAGVFVSSPSGKPGDRPTVRVRGVSTFGVADPLYVVDGVPITEYGSGYESVDARTRDLRGTVNILSMINPDDIESISVLKDASAAAIYGVRAANGVILITTKKGKLGRPKVDLSYSQGVQNFPNVYNLLNVEEYTELYTEANNNNPNFDLPPWFDPTQSGATDPSQRYMGDNPTIDWQQPFINKNASVVDASARIYGGTENTNYYVSTGYSYAEAPMRGNWQERYSLATNITSKIADWMEAGVTYRLAYVDAFDNLTGGAPYSFSSAVSAPPWQPIFIEDDFYRINSPIEDKYGYATTVDTVTTPNPNHPLFGGEDPDAPPYLVDYTVKYGTETEMNHYARGDKRLNELTYSIIRNIGNAYLQIEPIKGLKIRGGLSLDWYYNIRKTWSSIDAGMYSITPGNPYATGDGFSVGTLGERHNRNFNYVKELTVDWLKSFGDHNLNVTLNAMDQQYGFEVFFGGTEQHIFEDPAFRLITENQKYTSASSTRDQFALQGYMARASYNYASKYYVDVTVRRDGSSRFAPDYRWGTFPSFALAWRVSAENFMSGLTWINDLKIRAGWGQLGNQETKPFAYLSTVNQNPQYAYGSGGGDAFGTVYQGTFLPDFPTEDLSWETSTTRNLGFDGIFFNNRITATVEYYDRLTEGILQQVAFPSSVGNYNNPIINVASVQNKGWEFQLGYNGKVGDLEYFFNGNLTTVHNEVKEVWNDQPFGGQGDRIEEGYPLFYLWGFQTAGIFQSSEEVLTWWTKYKDAQADSSLVSPGDFYFKDVHGAPNPDEGYNFYSPNPDSLVNLNDRTFLGSTIPGHYYGFTFGANWKGFDFSIFFQGIGDVYKYNAERAKGTGMGSQGINQWDAVLNRWTAENPNQWDPDDKLNSLPRAVRNDPAGNGRFSDRFAEKAGFMRLKNVTLGYSLPQTLLGKTSYIERVRLYFSGTNVFTMTGWTGNDPENDNIPIPVTWTFGVNATF